MKPELFLFILYLSFGPTCSSGQEVKTIDSKPVSVALFNNRAIVTREATVNLSTGL